MVERVALLPNGSVNCDVHHPNPTMNELMPFLDDVWRDLIASRGITQLDSIAYPNNAPLTCRPDWRDAVGGLTNTPARLVAEALDRLGAETGILNNLSGVHMLYDTYMAVAVTKALNDWTRSEWLDKHPHLRASIVPPLQGIDAAVTEIDRCAADRRFVQILFPAAAHTPYGHRSYWPVYKAAVKHGLPIGIHAGSAYHHPVTSLGWPSTVIEDYAAQSQIMQTQLASLVSEGVFAEFPSLKVVLIESGISWLPAFLWRFGKFWKGLRFETPWVDRPPAEIIRDHVRLTTQPFDVPDDPQIVSKLLDHLGSDEMLLFSSDYPHWQFDDDAVLPAGFDASFIRKIAIENPVSTYPRLSEKHS
ncbi:amidohydrolase [Mesorhizobium sp. B2-4-14]|uniref:amidohydrolase family protein n=1 Tax=Mesorhizobium sp. B2-4-14 TaxID=2589935 RepID=UPI00112E82E2|nr:amidohydrolase family protein [Mesorhizobium sp. B2-4-14]TPK96492.1 amidohydrolase [Mesorhizobium sp. B2-4-14]